MASNKMSHPADETPQNDQIEADDDDKEEGDAAVDISEEKGLLPKEGNEKNTSQKKDMSIGPFSVEPFNPSSMNDGIFGKFMDPMMSQLEAKIAENTAILDKINLEMEEDREKRRKANLTRHIPGPLKENGQELKDVMRQLERLIIYDDYKHVDEDDFEEEEQVRAKRRKLDENSEVAVLSHSIAAYVSLLQPKHLNHIADKMIQDTTLWLSRLFRFKDSQAHLHEEERDGLISICKLVLYKKYPKYSEDGYEALYSKPPVIYMSEAATPQLKNNICKGLGLPKSCISLVSFMQGKGAKQKISCKELEKLIAEDLSSGKTPLLMIGFAGTPLVGHVDNLDKMKELCKKHGMWLHVEGNHLATLSMFSVPTDVQPASFGNSMTLRLGLWLGLPAIPYVTLYKTADKELAALAGLSIINLQYKLTCLPLWVCLQNMGHQGVVDKMKFCLDLAKLMYKKMEKNPNLKHISKPKVIKKKEDVLGIGDLISRAMSALLVFEISSPSVVFRYTGPTYNPDATKNYEKDVPEVAPYAPNGTQKDDIAVTTATDEEENDDEKNHTPSTDYLDSLNIWMVETMRRECSSICLEAVNIDKEGMCVRFAPFETAQVYGTTKEDMEEWGDVFERQIGILNATVEHRVSFQELVEAQDSLKLVNLPGWAGLGCIQYIPDNWLDKLEDLPEQGVYEINEVNYDLVKRLKANDTAFSTGKTQAGLICVRFGLITEDTDMEELVGLVYTTGKEIEESHKYIEKMADIVKLGIEAANKDLEKENEEKLMQEGILRKVPLVGSVMSWFSPSPKDVGIKGRTFNLSSGKVASTEETYKYHMQIQENIPENESSIRKVGPLKCNLKTPKRRTSSTGSNASSGTVPTLVNGLHSENNVSGNSSVRSDGVTGTIAAKPGTVTDTEQTPAQGTDN